MSTTLAGSAFLRSYRGKASSHIDQYYTIAFFVWLSIDTFCLYMFIVVSISERWRPSDQDD